MKRYHRFSIFQARHSQFLAQEESQGLEIKGKLSTQVKMEGCLAVFEIRAFSQKWIFISIVSRDPMNIYQHNLRYNNYSKSRKYPENCKLQVRHFPNRFCYTLTLFCNANQHSFLF